MKSFLKRKSVWLWTITFLVVGAAATGVIGFAIIRKDLPKPEQLEQRTVSQSTKIYDRTGQVLLYEIHGEEKRTVIPFNEIPEYVRKATIAIEDQGFYTNPGFDWRGILRSVLVNITRGRKDQGGSTITQQLAKNAFFSDEKTYIRKIRELLVAFDLEKRYSKDEILSLYLNQIPYGGNAYGIEAASQTFFQKSAKDLSLAEAATLAALPQAPSYYSPWGSHIDELINRRNYVLEQMQVLGYIDEAQKKQAQAATPVFAPKATNIKAPHFVLTVQEYLNNKYGEVYMQSAGLKVITTLDWPLQQLAEKVVEEGAARNKDLYQGYNAALVAQDATSGQVLALVGSKDYFAPPEPENCTPGKDCHFEGNFNVATQGLRQPGSTMKPFVYATAFEKGFSPDTVVFDVPTEFAANNTDKCPLDVDFNNEDDACFHPQNFEGTFSGPITLRNALAQSINVAAVKTLYLAGIDNTLKTASSFGIRTLTERSRYGLSLVLGGGEVTLTDLVGAYSVFAQEGIKHQQAFILSVTDSKNEVLESYKDSVAQVIEPQYPRLINDILSDTQARSKLFTSSLGLTIFPGHEVALKTGTTNDYRDAWTVGYTPDLVVGVWAGNNDNIAMQRHGGSILAAVPMWNAFMKEAIAQRPLTTFTKPDPITSNKTILRGGYITNFRQGDITIPHIHDILFYVDKNDPSGPRPQNPENDPQFINWEYPALSWAEKNIPDFKTLYNKPLPPDATEENEISNTLSEIIFISPLKGDFIRGVLKIQAQLNGASEIKVIQTFLNNQLIDQKSGSFGKNYLYQLTTSQSLELQNTLRIKITLDSGQEQEKSIIVFR